MKDNPLFYTASVAKVCAEQGYWDKSAQIYAYLLEKEPHRADLQQALAEARARSAASEPGDDQAPTQSTDRPDEKAPQLETLIQEWVGLLVERDLQEKFHTIRRRMRQATLKSES